MTYLIFRQNRYKLFVAEQRKAATASHRFNLLSNSGGGGGGDNSRNNSNGGSTNTTSEDLFFDSRKPLKRGIPEQFGIFYALGGALSMEGVLSGCYHICPTKVNFQFDTTFMYVIAVLVFLKVYQVGEG